MTTGMSISHKRHKKASSTKLTVLSFVEELKEICHKNALILNDTSDHEVIKIHAEIIAGFPLWFTFEILPEERICFVYGTIRTVGYPGDRSDYHDLLGDLWAIILRCLGFSSVRLVDIEHPVIEDELYGRHVLFGQGLEELYPIERTSYTKIDKLLKTVTFTIPILTRVFRSLCIRCSTEEQYDGEGGREWAEAVSRTLRLKVDHKYSNYCIRSNPHWSYFKRSDHGICSFKMVLPNDVLTMLRMSIKDKVVPCKYGMLVERDGFQNAISNAAISKIEKVLHAYEKKISRARNSLILADDCFLVPADSHLFCVTDVGIIALQCECGQRTFLEMVSETRNEYQQLANILFQGLNFLWTEKVCPERFESLILELLQREEGVSWARKIGHSSACDGERDIVAEWFVAPAPWQETGIDSPIEKRSIIIQCKAFKESINLSHVADIPKILDLHNASGYLFVAYPRVTPQVIDYFKSLIIHRKLWVDWWTKTEIERRLRENLDITSRFTDIVSIDKTEFAV